MQGRMKGGGGEVEVEWGGERWGEDRRGEERRADEGYKAGEER